MTPLAEDLTHFNPVLLSYSNRSIDLLCDSMDWFIDNSNAGMK